MRVFSVRRFAVIVLTLALAAVFSPVAAHAAPVFTTGRSYSLQSDNFPGRYVRHQWGLGELTTVSSGLDRVDATWRIVPGLAGVGISFESRNYPGQYLRHFNFRLQLNPSNGTWQFSQDATFIPRAGLDRNDGTWSSFESYNLPNHYLRHANFHLYIAPSDGSALFRKDATFSVDAPLA
jgi:hypothetical protein